MKTNHKAGLKPINGELQTVIALPNIMGYTKEIQASTTYHMQLLRI